MTTADTADQVLTRADRADAPFPTNAPPAVEQLSAVYETPVQLAAVLGKTTMPVSQLLRLGRGAVVELDRKVGQPV